MRSPLNLARSLAVPSRSFHVSPALARARVYAPIRNQGDFHTALRLSASANTPLITIWTASYCPSCRTVEPRLRQLLEKRGDGEPDLQYVEVEIDSQGSDIGELGLRYMIRSLPTILPFRRGEPVHEKRLTDVREMGDHDKLSEWVEDVARDGTKDRNGSSGGGIFGKLFG